MKNVSCVLACSTFPSNEFNPPISGILWSCHLYSFVSFNLKCPSCQLSTFSRSLFNMFQWSQASLMCKDIRSSTNVFFASKKKFLPWYQRRSFVNIVPLKFSQDSPSSGSSGSNDWTSVGNKRKGYQRNVAGLSVNRNDRRTKQIIYIFQRSGIGGSW